ncbi:MAG: hypothetical protein ACI8ZM_005420 [Crocinitomix sp.]|jgi:hypothetical protein
MLKYLSFLCFIVFISSSGYTQKERYLQLYGNPFISMFQDANSEFVLTSSPNTVANYAKLRSGEFGLIYRRKFENKMSWGLGIGSRFDNYSVAIAVVDIYTEDNFENRDVLDAHFINLYIRKTNLRFQFSYDLTERIGIGLNLNTYISTISSPNFNGLASSSGGSSSLFVLGDSSWNVFNYSYNLNIRTRGGNVSLVPELFITAELFKGLNFISSVKMAFWGKNSRYFDITSEGSFHPESGVYNQELLHESAISAKDFGYCMGFTYDLKLQKRK